jgi:plastocyanin
MRNARTVISHFLIPLASVAMACLLPAVAFGGTIAGKVDATPPKYVEDTVVYLKEVKGTYAPKKVTMDQKGMTFVPRLMAITVGDTVEFLNHDSVDHNVFSPDNEGYNLGMFKSNESRTYTFKKEAVAYTQLCSIHPEMLAYIFVSQNPYSATVKKDGKYTIDDVPPGAYEVMVWNPKLKGASQSVTVTASKTAEANISIKR